MYSKFEMLLQEMKENRSVSAITNPRSELGENVPEKPTSSRNITSEVENASNKKTRAEIQDTPFRSSEMMELRQPVEPLNLQNIDLEDTLIINQGPQGADYHMRTYTYWGEASANMKLKTALHAVLCKSLYNTASIVFVQIFGKIAGLASTSKVLLNVRFFSLVFIRFVQEFFHGFPGCTKLVNQTFCYQLLIV